MSRLAVILVLALAAYAQATTIEQDANGQTLCSECEKVIATLKKVVDNPESEQELLNTLKSVCDLPVFQSYKERCLNLVNNVEVVIHEIQGLLDDPATVCKSLRLCENEKPGDEPSVSSISKHLTLSFAAKILQDIQNPSANKADGGCWACRGALNKVKTLLNNNLIQFEIQRGFQMLCKYFGKFENQCDDFVNYHVPKLIKVLQMLVASPEQDCIAMKACSSPTANTFETMNDRLMSLRQNARLSQFLTKITTLKTANGIDVGCLACEAAVGGVEKALTQPKVLNAIATDITNVVCKILPKSMHDGCLDFLSIYAAPCLQLTFTEWTPKELCQDMHACSASHFQRMEAMPIMEKSAAVCDACKVASRVLSYELQQQALQQDVIGVFTRICKKIPAGLIDQCDDLVLEYVPAGFSYLADFLTRDNTCSAVHLC